MSAVPLKIVLSATGAAGAAGTAGMKRAGKAASLGAKRRVDAFFAQASAALQNHPALDLTLLDDAHPHRHDGTSRSSRSGLWALPGQLALISRVRPDVVMAGDRRLLKRLARLRRLTRVPFRIVYSNAAGLTGPFPFADAVHQLTRQTLAHSLEAGEPPERQFFMPCGFSVPPTPPEDPAKRATERERLGLRADTPLLLAVFGARAENPPEGEVAALLAAIAMLPEPRPHLALFGPASGRIARAQLGDGITVRPLSRVKIAPYYGAADALLIASPVKSARRILVEGLGRGLPVLADERADLGDLGGPFLMETDFSDPGAITAALASLTALDADNPARALASWHHVRALGWPFLADRYAAMLQEAAALPLRGARRSRLDRTRRARHAEGSGLGIAQ